MAESSIEFIRPGQRQCQELENPANMGFRLRGAVKSRLFLQFSRKLLQNAKPAL
jgi:hypothetical protein